MNDEENHQESHTVTEPLLPELENDSVPVPVEAISGNQLSESPKKSFPVLLVILVLALIIAVGITIYLLVVKSSSVVQITIPDEVTEPSPILMEIENEPVHESTAPATLPLELSDSRYLVIPEWGIKYEVPSTIKSLDYKLMSNDNCVDACDTESILITVLPADTAFYKSLSCENPHFEFSVLRTDQVPCNGAVWGDHCYWPARYRPICEGDDTIALQDELPFSKSVRNMLERPVGADSLVKTSFLLVPEFGMKFPIPEGFSDISYQTSGQDGSFVITEFNYGGKHYDLKETTGSAACGIQYLMIGACGNNSDCARWKNGEKFLPITSELGIDYAAWSEAGDFTACSPIGDLNLILKLRQMFESPWAI